jgi:hypothetical protein
MGEGRDTAGIDTTGRDIWSSVGRAVAEPVGVEVWMVRTPSLVSWATTALARSSRVEPTVEARMLVVVFAGG